MTGQTQLPTVVLYAAADVPVEGGVLSTPVPIPTDQLPEWWRCECGHRTRLAPDVTRARHAHGDLAATGPMIADGPFPVTVGIWQHRCTCSETPRHGLAPEDGCIVASVEVTGPSHHANKCRPEVGRTKFIEPYCPLDAPPDRWHTPTSAVTRLDVPIPMERPPRCDCEDVPVPASWWWADLNLEVPA